MTQHPTLFPKGKPIPFTNHGYRVWRFIRNGVSLSDSTGRRSFGMHERAALAMAQRLGATAELV